MWRGDGRALLKEQRSVSPSLQSSGKSHISPSLNFKGQGRSEEGSEPAGDRQGANISVKDFCVISSNTESQLTAAS